MTLRTWYEYGSSLTRPVTLLLKNRGTFDSAYSTHTPSVGAAISRPKHRIYASTRLNGTPPARSALGAPERGAGSPNGLTEGFS